MRLNQNKNKYRTPEYYPRISRLLLLFCGRLFFSSILFMFAGQTVAGQTFSGQTLPGRTFTAENGLIDLRGYDFHNGSSINLRGQWEFYYGRHLSPMDFHSPVPPAPGFIKVPSNWINKQLNGKNLPGSGIATYRLKILLPPGLKNQQEIDNQIGLRIDAVYTAYKLWINDRLVTEMGRAGKKPGDFKPFIRRFTYFIHPETDTLFITINVSNFLAPELSGLGTDIFIGPGKQIERANVLHDSLTVFVFGILSVMGLYHFVLFLIRKQEKSNLILSLISLLFALQVITGGGSIIHFFLPFISEDLSYRLWFATLTVVPFFFILLWHVFPEEIKRSLVLAISVPFALVLLLDIILPFQMLAPVIHFSLYLCFPCLAYLIFVLIKAFMKKRKFAGFYLVSFSIPLILAINDLLYSLGYLYTGHYSPLGMAVFVGSLSLIISMRFARSFEKVVGLSAELHEMNTSLERTVEERTTELKEANEDLIRLNRQKDSFLSIISHDLKNPFSNMLGITQFMQLNEITDKDERDSLVDSLHHSAERGYKLLENLLEWSRIQFHTQGYELKHVNLNNSLLEVSEFLMGQLGQKNIELDYCMEKVYRVLCDEHSLSTILRNLIANAIKFSHPEGKIIVSALECDNQVQIHIKDFGVGIPLSEQGRIFKIHSKYQREGTLGEPGSGLGLIIIKELVERNNGTITFISEENKGTEFILTFPQEDNLQ